MAQTSTNLGDPHAKNMTAVTKASSFVDPAGSTAGTKLRDALASVTNNAVLRGPAVGQITVPELGRVMVRAHNVSGAVDVDVTADRSDARAALRGHVSAMTTDLREADVPVARFTVDRANAAFGHSAGSSASFRDRGSPTHDTPRENPQPAEDSEQVLPTEVSAPRRVRIVL